MELQTDTAKKIEMSAPPSGFRVVARELKKDKLNESSNVLNSPI